MACLPEEKAYGALGDCPKAGVEGEKESRGSTENSGFIWCGFMSEYEGMCGGTVLSQLKCTYLILGHQQNSFFFFNL